MAKVKKNAAKSNKIVTNKHGGDWKQVVTVAKAAKAIKAKATKKVAAKGKEVAAKPTEKATLETAYRAGGGYANSLLALRNLGIGKMHSFEAILKEVKKVYGAAWKEFAAIKPRNKKTGKDADGRAMQNVSVIARKDYGLPVIECGYEVRWDGREKKAGLFKVGK